MSAESSLAFWGKELCAMPSMCTGPQADSFALPEFFAPRFDEATKLGGRMIKVIQDAQAAARR